MAPSQSATSSQSPAQTESEELSWEGDRMFNIYIYDYCFKRGYRETARALQTEADLPTDSQPPINAKQGLLFEWWSVFWVLFTAKSNGQGPEEALIYTQHQVNRSRDSSIRRIPNGAPLAARQAGGSNASNASMPNGVGPAAGPQAGNGYPNGAHPQNGQPNGVVGGSSSQQQQPPQQGAQPNASPNAPNANINGAPSNAGPTNAGAPTGQQQPPQSQQQQQQQQQQQSRPNAQGQQGQGRPPYQSPTMHNATTASNNAPNAPGSGQPYSTHGGMLMNHPNIAQMAQTLGRGVMPPPGPNGVQGGQGPSSSGNAPTPPQHNSFASSSRAATPAQGGMAHASPSLSARQIPTPTNMSFNINNMANPGMRSNNFQDSLATEISRLDPQLLSQIRNDLGIDNKEIPNMTMDEKNRIIAAARNQPSTSSAPAQQGGRGRAKRNSVSPGDEETPKNDASPPDRKRVRRSPNTNNLTVPANANTPTHTNSGGSNAPTPSGPNSSSSPMSGYPTGPNNMMRPGMNGAFPQQQGQQMNQPPMQHHMSPAMTHMHPPGLAMMTQQQQQQQMYQKQSAQYMQSLHNKMAPPQMGGPPGSDPNVPSDPQYNGQDGQRQGPPFTGGGLQPTQGQNRQGALNKPPIGGGMMPPPSSPLTNGMQKPQQGAGKSDGANTDASSNGSPHVAPATVGTATGPATPTSGVATGPAPSPSQILNNNRLASATPTLSNNTPYSRPPTANVPITQQPAASLPQPNNSLESLSASLDMMQGGGGGFTSFEDFIGVDFTDFSDDLSSWLANDSLEV